MSAPAKRRLSALSKQLVEGVPSPESYRSIPGIAQVAPSTPGSLVTGKIAIVTGANSALGIGRATVHLLAKAGARAIYICDWQTNLLDTHKQQLGELYPDCEVHPWKLDVGDEAAVKALCDEVVSRYGRLDIMFANAGIGGTRSTYDKLDAKSYMETFRVNSLGVFLCSKYAALAMQVTGSEKKYPGGSIIGTASVAGLRSNAGGTDYSASKASVVSLMQTMAYQLTGTGVRTNAVCPGIIETGMTEDMYKMARARGTESKIGQLNPLRRGGVADEIAQVVAFLASDASSYVNGQAWTVCGGLSAGHPFVPGKMS